VRGLTVIVTVRDPERLRAGLTLAAANAALEGRTRLFCQGEAVASLSPATPVSGDAEHRGAGLPTLAQLLDEALGLGVAIIACQSGLALMHIPADTLDPRIAFGGPVSVLQTLGEDRLLAL
jgi:predicted peroxiredoxin